MGSGMGGMGGMGGPGQTAPQVARPLEPAAIAAILEALAVNASRPAKKTIDEVLAGTFKSDSDRDAAGAAVATLLSHPSPESREKFLTVLITPEKFRPNPTGQGQTTGSGSAAGGYSGAAGGTSSAYAGSGSGPPPGYSGSGSGPPAGYMGSGSGPPAGYSGSGGGPPPGYGSSGYSGGYGGGYRGESQAKLTASELQAKAVELLDRLASEELRAEVARRLVDPKTPPAVRGLVSRPLLAPNPKNVAAQVVFHTSSLVDANTHGMIERLLTKHSSDTLAMILGVPFQATLTEGPGRGGGYGQSGRGSGSGYAGGSGMPATYQGGGGPPPGYQGTSAPPGAGGGNTMPYAGGSNSGMTPPGGQGTTPYAGQQPAGGMMPPGTAMGMGQAGMTGVPGAGIGLAPPGLGAMPFGLDPDQPFRVAQQLWGKQLATAIEGQLEQVGSLQEGASRVLLASTVPTDAVRAKLFQTLRRCWQEGPRGLEDAGLGTSLLSDPGFLVVMKALPRKDPPSQEGPKKSHRNSRRQAGNQGGPGGPGGSGQPYGPGGDGGARGPGQAQPKDKEVDKPEYNWMGACESLARAMCDQYATVDKLPRGLRRNSGGDVTEKRPVEIPASITPAAEYRFEWPQGVSSAKTKLAGVPLDPMTVYYARLNVSSAPAKVLAYYRRQLGGRPDRQADVGYWLESVHKAEDSDRQMSIDVLVCRKEERGGNRAARPGSGGPGGYGPYGPGMGGSGGGSGYGPPPGMGGSGGAPPYGSGGAAGRGAAAVEKAEKKDAPVDLIVEILAVEINSPAGAEEPAKTSKKDKRAASDAF